MDRISAFHGQSRHERWKFLFWRLGCAFFAALAFRVGWTLLREALELEVLDTSRRYQVAIAATFLFSLLSLLLLASSFWKAKAWLQGALQRIEQYLVHWGRLNLLGFLLINGILTYLLIEASGSVFQPYWSRLSSLVLIALLGIPFLQIFFRVNHHSMRLASPFSSAQSRSKFFPCLPKSRRIPLP